jgi:hypothetical protein
MKIEAIPTRRTSLRWMGLVLAAGCGGAGADANTPQDPYTEAYQECMGHGGMIPAMCEVLARQKVGPQQKGNSEEQWIALEKAAEAKAREAGATEVGAAVRLRKTGFMVEHPIEVQSNHCYDVGIAWSSGWKTAGAIIFVSKPGGQSPNTNLGGKNLRLDAPDGSVSFCADNPGIANLTLSGVGTHGAILNNENLEYVIVVGAKKEAPEQTVARRKAEAEAAEEGRSKIEVNLYDAESRKYGPAVASGCMRCRKQYRNCYKDQQKAAKGEDVSKEAIERCFQSFETCAQAMGMDERGRILCSSPPG